MSLPPLDDPSSPALITTDCSNGILRLPNVVTEVDGTTLGSFTVTSRTAQPLLVKLQTSAPNAVTFQLENENLRHAGIAAEDDDPEDWNALFNEVGHISELLLPPHGSTKVVVSFRPKPLIDASDAVEHETSSKNRPFGETTRKRHAVQEARTSIQLIAVPQPSHEPLLQQQQQLTAAQQPQPQWSASQQPPAPPQQQPSPAPPVVLVLSARHCVSLLYIDEHELSFDRVIVGSTEVKDFTVWNCSEVPLRFRLALSHQKTTTYSSDERTGERADVAAYDTRPVLDFFDADSGVPLPEAGQLVLGYSHTRVRAYLTPKEVGHFPMKLSVNNLMDARNKELLRVHVVVTSTVQEEGLRLMTDGSDGTIDFGHCFAWMTARSTLTVRNTSDKPLDVHFSSDEPEEVSFDLAVAAEDGDDEDDIDSPIVRNHRNRSGVDDVHIPQSRAPPPLPLRPLPLWAVAASPLCPLPPFVPWPPWSPSPVATTSIPLSRRCYGRINAALFSPLSFSGL